MAKRVFRRLELIDSFGEWIPFLAWTARRRIEADAGVVSISMPNSCHVATLLALAGRRNYWWADFGDPWVLNRSQPRGGLRLRVEAWLEASVVRRADLVTFTTEATLRDYKERYPEAAGKMNLARMGHAKRDGKTFETQDDAVVFYGGTLPPENRSASEFLSAAAAMRDVNFLFAGPCTVEVRKHFSGQVPSNVSLIEWLSDSEFRDTLRHCHVGVIFGNSNAQQIPGKVYQYLAYASRILYVSGSEVPDESAAVLGVEAVTSRNEKGAIEESIRSLLSAPGRDLSRATGFDWEQVLAPALRLFEQGSRRMP